MIELNRSRNNVVLSRRAVLEDERKEMRQAILDRLNPGDVVEGQISNIVDFGAFVDLDGMDGLIHISELSWSHVNHPSEVLEIGQDVKVKVLDIDRDRQRISLGLKQTQTDPWQQVLDTYGEGDVVEGRVTKVVTFGAFVEILPGVEGLVHISELAQHHVENPREVVSQGDLVNVKIIEVDAERRRLSLSLKRVEPGESAQPPIEGGEPTRPAIDLSEDVFPDSGIAGEVDVEGVVIGDPAEPVVDLSDADEPDGEPAASEEFFDESATAAEEPAAEEPAAEEPAAEEPAAEEPAAEEPAAEEDVVEEVVAEAPVVEEEEAPAAEDLPDAEVDEAVAEAPVAEADDARVADEAPAESGADDEDQPAPADSECLARSAVALAVTGGIGAGKSEALKAFARHGAATISSDEIVHRLLREHENVQRALVERLGEGILDEAGQIDRSAIAEIVFADREALDWLESLLHPLVVQEYLEWREQLAALPEPPSVSVTEVPLLYEVGGQDRFDAVVVVTAPEELRRARSRVAVDERSGRLVPDEEKVRRADFAYVNDGSLEELDAFRAPG